MARNRDAFVRLANARVSKAIEAIRLVGNLSNKANYEYTCEDSEKMIEALRQAVMDCRKRFEMAERSEKGAEFRLDQ